MHYTSVVPENEITVIFPLHAVHVLFLGGVGEQLFNQLGTFSLGHSLERLLFGRHKFLGSRGSVFEMMYVIGDIKVLSATGMRLHDIVSAKRIIVRINIFQPWTIIGCSLSARMHYAVGANVLGLEDCIPQVFRKLLECCPRVCKVGVPSVALGREAVRTKKTKSGSSRVEARVNMENTIALHIIKQKPSSADLKTAMYGLTSPM